MKNTKNNMGNAIFKRAIIVTCFIIFSNFKSIGCFCDNYESYFCRNANERYNIVLAVVTDSLEPHLMEAVVLENIYNETARQVIDITGHDGGNCGEYLELFHIGDTLIFALHETEYEGTLYWDLNGLGGRHYLEYKNGKVFGPIQDNIDSISLDEFRENIDNCIKLINY